MTRPARARLSLLVPLVVLAAVAVACGDDDGDDGEALAADTTTEDTEGAATTEVVAVDYHFEGLPETIESGTTLTMHNDSDHEVHELFAMKIPAAETRSVAELIALPENELFAALPGEPATVLVAPPGDEAIAVLGDGTLEPGRYLVACAIPTGADPAEFMRQAQAGEGPPDVPGGPPHFVSGMYAELVVT
jgi:uncharacterized cupredoxin-like copper-binding protein